MFNDEVSVGNLVAIGAAVISAAAVLAALAKERDLRKKELADRVRQATALVVAKLDRWKQIGLQTFDQLQMAATDADGALVENADEIKTRDAFWKQVVMTQTALAKSVLDEEIEVAYSGLYGYDPRIHELFTGAVQRLRHIESLVFLQVLNRTQNDILTVRSEADGKVLSAQLGNRLRRTLAASRSLLDEYMEAVLIEFRKATMAIICASDEELVERKIAIPSSITLPEMTELQEAIYSAPREDRLDCRAISSLSRSSVFGSRVFEPWPLAVEFPEDLRELLRRSLVRSTIQANPSKAVGIDQTLDAMGAPKRQEMQMITAVVTFTLPKPITRDEARSIFLTTAPAYQGVPGLVRKVYVLSEDGFTSGGVYLWNSRSEAEAMYTQAWREFVRGTYGTDPTVIYFESPVVVDNVTRQVLADE